MISDLISMPLTHCNLLLMPVMSLQRCTVSVLCVFLCHNLALAHCHYGLENCGT